MECPICKNIIYVCPSTLKERKNGIKYCSMFCKIKAIKNGETNFGFKNEGADKSPNKYPRKQINGIRLKEHRRIMQEHLGRKLEKWEVVHHINNDPKDNRIENLTIVTPAEHGRLHKLKK